MDRGVFSGLAKALQCLALPAREDQFAALLARLDAVDRASRAASADLDAPALHWSHGRLSAPAAVAEQLNRGATSAAQGCSAPAAVSPAIGMPGTP